MRQIKMQNTFFLAMTSALVAYFLVACQPNQRLSPGSTTTNVAGHSSATASGPIDSGGENLINGVALETYEVDITSLEEFKLLKPVLHSLSVAYSHDFIDFAKMRNWYFIPVSLADLPNQVVGVDLKNGATQTIALQGQNEIWIDNNLYKKQSNEEKSKILLHEIVRILNSLKYKSMKDICRDWLRAGNDCEPHQLLYNQVKAMQPILSPGLNNAGNALRKSDTEDIRDMTLWLFNSKGNLSAPEIYKRFSTFNFDQRYFEPSEKLVWPSRHISISEDEFNFLVDQILDANNNFHISRNNLDQLQEDHISAGSLVIDTGNDNGQINTNCTLNIVTKDESSKPYNIIPNKQDMRYESLKKCLSSLTFKSYSESHNYGVKYYDLRWVYDQSGPMILFSAPLSQTIDIRKDPTASGDVADLRTTIGREMYQYGYFIFSPSSSDLFSVKDLKLRGFQFDLIMGRYPTDFGISADGLSNPYSDESEKFGYVAEGIRKEKSLFCALPHEMFVSLRGDIVLNGTTESVLVPPAPQIGGFAKDEHVGDYSFDKYFRSDRSFLPSCTSLDLSKDNDKKNMPKLFDSLKSSGDAFDGKDASYDDYLHMKYVMPSETWLDLITTQVTVLNECEHPSSTGLIKNSCAIGNAPWNSSDMNPYKNFPYK